jgi:filamentous hemagglutinin family protein
MTPPARKDNLGRHLWRAALPAGMVLQATLMISPLAPAAAQPAQNAQPTGGVVVGGAASIRQTREATTIDQASQRAAVNWQTFNVGSEDTVMFDQPSASAVALNRVTGPDPSQIAGHIDANGQIALVNQSGVLFYKGAQVNTAGLIVSSAGISNANFMAGRMIFDQPGNSNAQVVNQGTVTVRQAGLAALVAPQVANSGVIDAKLGHVVLAGANTATLDMFGDGLLSLDVGNEVTQAPTGATALVTNTGVIHAGGGTVQLTARAADSVIQNLVQAGGKVSAKSAGGTGGTVVLNGVGGAIIVTGQLLAQGAAAGSTGGGIEVDTNDNVTVAATARIDASGQAGGGVVAIGTTLARAQGGPGTPSTLTAANTSVAAGATIAANATANGNGGRVSVLSEGQTGMAGSISATGGPQGGNGGFVEVSGATLSLTGTTNVSAPMGATGTILLDPSGK